MPKSESLRLLSEDEIEYILDFIEINEGLPYEIAKGIQIKNKNRLKKQLENQEIYPSLIDELKEIMRIQYYKTIAQPGESVGILTAQSIGERQTQQTLNSIDWKEMVVLKVEDKIIISPVGEVIDNLMNNNKKVTYLENEQEYLEINDLKMEIPTTNEDGYTSWKKVEAITRHPGEVIQVTTKSGRRVVASLGKSFLTMQNNKLVATDGKDLKLGDKIPVTINFPKPSIELKQLCLEQYLSKTKYIYGSELFKVNNFKETSRVHNWWQINQDKIKIPFKRPDTAIDCFKKGKIQEGFIYPVSGNRKLKLPEKIPLDEDFGFFIGAYLAEGCCTKTQVIISNNDEKFRNRIIRFCNRYNLGYHIQYQPNKNFENATSIDVRIHSTILVDLMTQICGTGSVNKKIPTFSVVANEVFISELLNGYFSGDGSVNSEKYYIYCSSASELLIDGINLLLNRFGIFSIKRVHTITKNNIGSVNILPSYLLYITCGNIKTFYSKIKLELESKSNLLHNLVNKPTCFKYSKFDKFDLNIGDRIINIRRDKMASLDYPEYNETIVRLQNNDILMDEIVSIKNVQSTSKFLYDFTVEETRNFNLFNGLAQRDTFHSAGLAIKTVITGVPRFSELLNATKEPKARSTQIFFNQGTDSIKNLRNVIGNKIREFKFKDLVNVYKIEKEKEREEWYDYFDMVYKGDESKTNSGYSVSFTLNKELLYEYKIGLELISNQIYSSLEGVDCIFSPDFIGKIDIYVDTSEIEIGEDMDDFEDACRYHIRDVVIPNLFQVRICGIPNVENVFLDKKGSEWFAETEGSNYQEILGLRIVDQTRVISNDMWEIYNTLGIEAARNFLIDEFTSVISSDGTDVNDSHTILLVDLMTFSGNIIAISRYGHKKENCGPMAKASFEESLENFLKAGVFGEKESTNGVSASVMLGKVPRIGTGLCDVLIDVRALPGCPSYLKDKIEEVGS